MSIHRAGSLQFYKFEMKAEIGNIEIKGVYSLESTRIARHVPLQKAESKLPQPAIKFDPTVLVLFDIVISTYKCSSTRSHLNIRSRIHVDDPIDRSGKDRGRIINPDADVMLLKRRPRRAF